MTTGLTVSGKLRRIFFGVYFSVFQYFFWWIAFKNVSTILLHVSGTIGIAIIGIIVRKNLNTTYSTDGSSLTETGRKEQTIEYCQVTRLDHQLGNLWVSSRNSCIGVANDIVQKDEFYRRVLLDLAAVKDIDNVRMRGEVEEIRRLLEASE